MHHYYQHTFPKTKFTRYERKTIYDPKLYAESRVNLAGFTEFWSNVIPRYCSELRCIRPWRRQAGKRRAASRGVVRRCGGGVPLCAIVEIANIINSPFFPRSSSAWSMLSMRSVDLESIRKFSLWGEHPPLVEPASVSFQLVARPTLFTFKLGTRHRYFPGFDAVLMPTPARCGSYLLLLHILFRSVQPSVAE